MGMPPPPPGGVAGAPFSPGRTAGGGSVRALLIALLVLGVIALFVLIVVGILLVAGD